MQRALVALVLLVSTIVFAAPGRVTVTDQAIVPRDPIELEGGNKPVIKPASYATLDAVAAALDSDKRIALVEIQSHTDTRGSADWNLEVSEARARAIYDYLVAKGVDARRLRAKGYGESRPLDKGTTAKAQARNRRIAFVILQRVT